MIIDILIWVLFIYFACGLLTGKFPHEILPPVKRHRARQRVKRENERILDQLDREERQRERDALRALRVDDVAFLSAGGFWRPPTEVTERLAQEKFLRDEEAREIERQKRRKETAELTAKLHASRPKSAPRAIRPGTPSTNGTKMTSEAYWARVNAEAAQKEEAARRVVLDTLLKTYTALGIPHETINVADKAEPVAVIRTGTGVTLDSYGMHFEQPAKPHLRPSSTYEEAKASGIDSQQHTTDTWGRKVTLTHYRNGVVTRTLG